MALSTVFHSVNSPNNSPLFHTWYGNGWWVSQPSCFIGNGFDHFVTGWLVSWCSNGLCLDTLSMIMTGWLVSLCSNGWCLDTLSMIMTGWLVS